MNTKFSFLRTHQNALLDKIPMQYENTRLKGMLLWHSTGSGKTITAICMCLREMLYKDVIGKIFVLTPKSIQNNFKSDMEKLQELLDNDGFERLRLTSIIEYLAYNSDGIKDGILDIENSTNTYIVIDEAHNLFNGIINESSRALRIYAYLKVFCIDCRIYLLSGTPIVNGIRELAACLNILIKPLLLRKGAVKQFFVNEDDLQDKDITPEQFIVKYFKPETKGFVSYYNSGENVQEYQSTHPVYLGTKIEMCEMTSEEYETFYIEYLKEISKFNMMRQYSQKGADIDVILSKTLSRMACNTQSKVNILLNNIAQTKGQTMIYSQFTNDYGIGLIEQNLRKVGYKTYQEQYKPGFGYAIITGDIKFEDRKKIQDIFNSKENIDGDIIRILFISSAGAEGLDLKRIQHVHIFEPYWNNARVLQLIGRSVRYLSHEDIENKSVQAYVYISVYGNAAQTTDSWVYDIANRKQKEVELLMDSLKMQSLESPDEVVQLKKVDDAVMLF